MIIAAVGIGDWQLLAAEDASGKPRRHQRLERKIFDGRRTTLRTAEAHVRGQHPVDHRRRHCGR
jgi:hypothetical protein